jgi:TetR/AcrR family transcriptional regulator, cholesterol catabolism regulator
MSSPERDSFKAMAQKTNAATVPQSGIGKRRLAARTDGNAEYQARRQELIRVAATVFKEKGYEAATLNDIAARVGSDRASLYYYVGSKEELFQEAVRGVLDENVAAAERILEGNGNAREKLERMVKQLISSYEENYPYMYVYIQEDMRKVASGETPWARQMTRQTRRFESITIRLVEQGIDEGIFRDDIRVDLATNALFGMTNWTHRWFKPGRQLRADEMAEAFCTIFFDGMMKRP